MSAVPEITMHIGQNSNGFEVKDVTPLEALRSVAYQLEHKQSGARLLHLYNQDAENLFSVSFPTPPPDDTGIPDKNEYGNIYQCYDRFRLHLLSSSKQR